MVSLIGLAAADKLFGDFTSWFWWLCKIPSPACDGAMLCPLEEEDRGPQTPLPPRKAPSEASVLLDFARVRFRVEASGFSSFVASSKLSR